MATEDPQKDRTVTCRAKFCDNGGKVRDMVKASKVKSTDKLGFYCPSCAANGGRRTVAW